MEDKKAVPIQPQTPCGTISGMILTPGEEVLTLRKETGETDRQIRWR